MGRLTRKLQTLLPLPPKPLTTHMSFSRLPKSDAQTKSSCLLKRLGSAHIPQAAATTPPPKGHLPIRVVNSSCISDDGLLYFIKAEHLNHPLILDLLQRAAEEYGYSRVGALQVNCDTEMFEDVLSMLDSSR
ncbi:hypothetical protein GOP47_0005722 [Adiantum capillus-veneris]|uniref:Uncharacterized protein n=1 Tax=Adiantum capillus-veneris TaxID=13818 RepID=A0A9D4ZLN2_ADICA|nr:hypothetical protein GOP47_0005722 [Adiantum capillus-veneris]